MRYVEMGCIIDVSEVITAPSSVARLYVFGYQDDRRIIKKLMVWKETIMA
jgi:hypothetical protein